MSNFILTTPSSRGIGFAITRLLLTSTTLPIIATARKDVERAKQSLLEGLKDVDPERLHVRTVDVTGTSIFQSLFFNGSITHTPTTSYAFANLLASYR